jgi:F0F1-type ATP synthase membrane subunit b/b'
LGGEEMTYKERAEKIEKMLTDAEKELRELKEYARENKMIMQDFDNWLTLLVAWANANDALDAIRRFKENCK